MQLLVSESDVDNYKQIKADLDELRLMVEKSELWVYKSKNEGGKKKKKADGDDDKVRTKFSETNTVPLGTFIVFKVSWIV